MKYICLLFLCALVAGMCVSAQEVPTKKCPPGEHSVLYCPRKAEPDCDNLVLRPKFGPCGVPDCFCDTQTVRDLSTGNCVTPDKCPKN